MKNRKRLAISALAVITTLCAFVGCKCSCGGTNDSKDSGKTENPLTWTIADFETWETGIQLIRTTDYFGTIRQNEDPQYVKSGKGSALLHPLGGYRAATDPLIFYPTYSEVFDFDNRDFSAAKNITFEFYNDEETAVKVAVGLVTAKPTVFNVSTTPYEYHELAPKQWTTVSYEVDVSTLSIDVDVKNVEGVYMAFENAHSREEADAPDIYVDDIVLHRYEVAPEIQNLIDLGEYEYLDFEKDWQKYVISARATANAPTYEIVNASDYKVGPLPAEGEEDTRETLQAKSGEKVLRMVAIQGQNVHSYYPAVQFSKALLGASYFSKVKEEDYGSTYFALDFFYNAGVPQTLSLIIHPQNENMSYEFAIDESRLNLYGWNTMRFSLKQLYEWWQEKYPGSNELFESPGMLEFLYAEFNQGGNREIFIDNIRFETEEKDTTAAPEITVRAFKRVAQVGEGVEFPIATAVDKYDLNVDVTLTPYYNNNGTWTELSLERGKVPIEQVGEYKYVVSATNSMGNTTTNEYFFRGEESVEKGLLVDYSYADQTTDIFTHAPENVKTWQESITIGGETRQGVVKVELNKAESWGAGIVGFTFSGQGLNEGAEAEWDYLIFDMYIESSVGALEMYSQHTYLGTIRTGQWIQFKITKETLNGNVSAINETGAPLTDKAFYNSVYEKLNTTVGRLFYTNQLNAQSPNAKITYYFDKVVWVSSQHGDYDDDFMTPDIYDNGWTEPNTNIEE